MALTDGLIAWYDFQDNGDDSENSNDLTASGNATYTASGKVGKAADLPDTSTDYFGGSATNITFDGTEDRTFAFWVKRNSGTSRDRIMGIWSTPSGDKNFLFTFWDSGELNISSGSGSTTLGTDQSTTDISDGSWHFCVVTYYGTSDDKFRYYLDGSTTAEMTTVARNVGTSTAEWRIGQVDALPPDAYIDSVGVWDRVISSSEITELYNSGNGLDYDDISGGGAVVNNAVFFGGGM